MEKRPGDTFGVGLLFDHKGGSEKVWVGVGLSQGRDVSKNIPFFYAMNEVEIPSDRVLKTYYVTVESTIPAVLPSGTETIDVLRFISKTQPVANEYPLNEYRIDDWGEDKYTVVGAIPAIDGGLDLTVIMSGMVTVMIVSMMGGMMGGVIGK